MLNILPETEDTRIATYLSAVCGNLVNLTPPRTREEQFLAVWAGMDVSLPEAPYTHFERFLLGAMYGVDAPIGDNIYDSHTMGEQKPISLYTDNQLSLQSGNAGFIIPIKPNTKYKVWTTVELTIWRMATWSAVITEGETVAPNNYTKYTENTPFIFTSARTDQYLYVQCNSALFSQVVDNLYVKEVAIQDEPRNRRELYLNCVARGKEAPEPECLIERYLYFLTPITKVALLDSVTAAANSYILVDDGVFEPTDIVEFEFSTKDIASSMANYFGGRFNGAAAGSGIRITKLSNNGVAMYAFDPNDAYESGGSIIEANTRYLFRYRSDSCSLYSGETLVDTHDYHTDDRESTDQVVINGYISTTTPSAGTSKIVVHSLKRWNKEGRITLFYQAAVMNDIYGMYDYINRKFVQPDRGYFGP